MFRIALAFCAGAAAVHALPALWPPAVALVLGCSAVLCARRFPPAAAVLAGFAWTHFLASLWLAQGWPCARDREEIELVGQRVSTIA